MRKTTLWLNALIIAMVFMIVNLADASTKDKSQKIVSFLKSDAVKTLTEENFNYNETEDETQIIKDWSLFSKTQLAKLKDYRWVEHMLYLREVHIKETQQTFSQFTIIIKEKFSALSPDSHTYMEWILTDPGIDGQIHRVKRDWIIVMENYKNDEGYNIQLIPQWPPELRNFMKKIWNPTKEEGQFKYELELAFWLTQIKKWENK